MFLAGEAEAVAEVRAHYHEAGASSFALHDAQLVLRAVVWPRQLAEAQGLRGRRDGRAGAPGWNRGRGLLVGHAALHVRRRRQARDGGDAARAGGGFERAGVHFWDAGRLRDGVAEPGKTLAETLLDSAASGGDPEIVRMALERIDWPPDDPRWYRILWSPLVFWNHIERHHGVLGQLREPEP